LALSGAGVYPKGWIRLEFYLEDLPGAAALGPDKRPKPGSGKWPADTMLPSASNISMME
jgi:hypothetical protein